MYDRQYQTESLRHDIGPVQRISFASVIYKMQILPHRRALKVSLFDHTVVGFRARYCDVRMNTIGFVGTYATIKSHWITIRAEPLRNSLGCFE